MKFGGEGETERKNNKSERGENKKPLHKEHLK